MKISSEIKKYNPKKKIEMLINYKVNSINKSKSQVSNLKKVKMQSIVEVSQVVEVVMNSEVVLKSNKRRINFLLSKILELQEELKSLEAAEEAFEASRSRNVTKRSKGRPQAKKEQEAEVDLFANLVKEVVSSSSECAVSEDAVAEEKPAAPAKKEKVSKPPAEKKEKVSKPLKHVLSEEEKAEKKAQLEAEKAEKAALKKAQLEAEKLAKAEEKKAQLEADKQAKVAEKLAMAAADKESKKAQLEAEKLLKKQALLAEKEAKKQVLYEEKLLAALKKLEAKQALAEAKKQSKALKKAATVAPKEEVVAEVEAPVEKVTVSRITINDIKYLKSSTNILYNPDTREEVGLYDPETKMIKPLPDDEEEEMTEDTYESDNE